MREILKLVLALGLISSLAGVILAFTNKVTAQPIERAAQAEVRQALSMVLPAYDNEPDTTVLTVVESNQPWRIHVARKDGRYVGAAFVASSSKGYGDAIGVMVGVTAADIVKQVRILSQKETPGLGTKVTEAPFRTQFDGKPVEGTVWAVRKDQGDFDGVTGATISSRAVLEAIRSGLDVYAKHRNEISRTGE
jgi:electron transport complex protein RnfG